jgi:hypothetical protein
MTKRFQFAVVIGLIASALVLILPPAARGQQEEAQSEEKTFIKDAPLSWELARRLSEQALEEYLPKAAEVMKAFNSSEFDAELKWVQALERAAGAWFDVILYQKKSDNPPADQKEWSDEYNNFLLTLRNNGKLMVVRMARRAQSIEMMTRAAENAPVKLEKLKKDWQEADAVLAEAKNMMYGSWSREQLKNAPALLERVKTAVNLLSAVIPSLISMRDYAMNRGAKPDFATEEQSIINLWKGLPDTISVVQKSFRQMPKDWIPIIQARRDAEVKAWEAVVKAYEPVVNKTINSSFKYYNGQVWDSLVDSAKRDQDFIFRKIVGEGNVDSFTSGQEKAEEELTKKERARLVEINSLQNPYIENKLQLALINADSDSEKKAAEAAMAKYKADKAKLDAEYKQIIEKHNQRRKKLGMPSAFSDI